MTALLVSAPGGLAEACMHTRLALKDPLPGGRAGGTGRAQPWVASLETSSSGSRKPEGCDAPLPEGERSLRIGKGFETNPVFLPPSILSPDLKTEPSCPTQVY